MNQSANMNSDRLLAWKSHPSDSVAVALRSLEPGQAVEVEGTTVRLLDHVPFGHKIALSDHLPSMPVLRYGERIGIATRHIEAGSHVHSHNLATALSGERAYAPVKTAKDTAQAAPLPNWWGYRRADGRFATRNEVWLLPTVGCVAPTVDDVARRANARHAGTLDAIVGFGHPHGCSQLGDDLAGTRAALAALCDNPNAGGIVLMGLGCESNQLDDLLACVPARSRAKIRALRAQDAGDEAASAMALVDELVEELSPAQRTEAPASGLSIGLNCGGSDAFSGLTANPLLGRFSERVAASGGQVILTEIPEVFGAEDALLARAVSHEVFESAGALLNRFKRYFLEQGLPVSENPSPGNIEGGITTLEEKSLGAVQKAGMVPLADVIDYGSVASVPGLTLLEAPGNDAVSSTALAAAGANLILFTTGRGTPLGFPVPTVKISTNSRLAEEKSAWIDFDAGRMLDDTNDTALEAFSARMLEIASGEATAAERNSQKVISLWKRGVTL